MPSSAELKSSGSNAFKRSEFREAVGFYSRALTALRDEAVSGAAGGGTDFAILFSNRSAALLKLNRHREALEDGDKAVQIDPTYIKGHHRRAQALLALKRHDEAREAYSAALLVEPGSAFLKQQVELLDRKLSGMSAIAKINRYVEVHGTIEGCSTKLSLSMFDLDACLGDGNYSLVHRVRFDGTSEVFALKIVDKTKVDRMSKRHPNIYNELKMEKHALEKMPRHPNLIKFYHTFQDASHFFVLTEYASGGELWAKLRYSDNLMKALRPSEARFYVAQVLNGLQHIAAHRIVHRDIKPENVMLCATPGCGVREASPPRGYDAASACGRSIFAKIIDFGTARDLDDDSLAGPNFVGTPEYMSPEVIRSKPASHASDLWALGCTLFQLLTGFLPFKGGSPFLTFQRAEATAYELPDYVDPDAADLIERLLLKEPSARLGGSDPVIGFSEVKAHQYFKGVDFDLLAKRPLLPVPTLSELCIEAVGELCLTKHGRSVLGRASAIRHARLRPGGTLSPSEAAAADTRNAGSACVTGVFPADGEGKVDARIRATLMGYLEQRAVLGLPHVFPLFFTSRWQSLARRAARRSFIGMSQQEQGEYRTAFLAVHLGGLHVDVPESADVAGQAARATLRRINALEPRPRLLIISGGLVNPTSASASVEDWDSCAGAARKLLVELREGIPAIVAPGPADLGVSVLPCDDGGEFKSLSAAGIARYREAFGDDYFSCFAAGAFVIVVNSTLLGCAEACAPVGTNAEGMDGKASMTNNDITMLDEESVAALAEAHASWFDRQLLTGKLCARHVIVVSYHRWFLRDPSIAIGDASSSLSNAKCDGPDLMPQHISDRFLRSMQECGVEAIFSHGRGGNSVVTARPQNDLEPKMRQVSTAVCGGDHGNSLTEPVLRIVRVFGSDIVSDVYYLNELPSWFSLDDPDHEEMIEDNPRDDDSISESDDDD